MTTTTDVRFRYEQVEGGKRYTDWLSLTTPEVDDADQPPASDGVWLRATLTRRYADHMTLFVKSWVQFPFWLMHPEHVRAQLIAGVVAKRRHLMRAKRRHS